MKVQLIVVQGRPEGKVIPLTGPSFKIGRGETCHLRPNSEQVSREHAAFSLTEDTVSVQDLGSRNGTLVNGKALTEPCVLKDNDLVQVGPLTFSVSIKGAAVAAKPASPVPSAKRNLEGADHDDIEAWLIADSKNPAPERPSGVYGGDTITIAAFKDASSKEAEPAKNEPAPRSLAPAKPVKEEVDSDEEYERLSEGAGDDDPDSEPNEDETVDSPAEVVDEFIDESNPFYVKKKAPEGPTKPVYKDTSDAASDILRKMMERRRGSR
ncbi:MAG: hypothetical protein NVSMB9_13010 [Isosphaeraceae bacterium]